MSCAFSASATKKGQLHKGGKHPYLRHSAALGRSAFERAQPFSEWPQVFTNARLCKAVLDRLTDQAHIIETGSESYRFRRTLRKKPKL
jgi:IstB-like ATP binding protein